MRVRAFMITQSDVRYFAVEPGYTYGHYLELDKPTPANTRNNLVVYRVPEGTTAPLGRLPDEVLLALGEQASLPVAEPQVIARFPFWSYIVENGLPFDAPDGTEVEPVRLYPPSTKDGVGRYVQPANAFTPLPEPKPAKPEKLAKEN